MKHLFKACGNLEKCEKCGHEHLKFTDLHNTSYSCKNRFCDCEIQVKEIY